MNTHGSESRGVVVVVSAELRLAHEFMRTLDDVRPPWSARFEAWADERGLTEELARSTKVAVLRLRMFGAGNRQR